jgi:hypothetical protein
LLEAVVDRVADEVGQRILDRLEERLVDLGVLAVHLEAGLLAARQREIAHDARELVPDVLDGLHARLHHALLQLGRDQVEALRRGRELGVAGALGELQDLVAGEHELADQVHQVVEQADVDADGLRRRRALLGLLGLECVDDLVRGQRLLLDEQLADVAGVALGLELEGVVELLASDLALADELLAQGEALLRLGVRHEVRRGVRRRGRNPGGGLRAALRRALRGLGGAHGGEDRALDLDEYRCRDHGGCGCLDDGCRDHGGCGCLDDGCRLDGCDGDRCGRRGGRRRSDIAHRLATVQASQAVDELGVGGRALGPRRLDVREDLADGIHHREQAGGDLGRHGELTVAQLRQQALADVRDGLQGVEAEEAGRALDRVDRPEDPGDHVLVRVLLEFDQALIELIEVLVALGDELVHDLVQLVVRHHSPPPSGVRRGAAPVAARMLRTSGPWVISP